MDFARPLTIIVLTLLWAAGQFGIQYSMSGQMVRETHDVATTDFEQPELQLWLEHACCTSCSAEIGQLVKKTPGLGKPVISSSDLTSPTSENTRIGRVDIPVTDPSKLDFVRLRGTFEDAGYRVTQMVLGGLPHPEIVLELPLLSHPVCVQQGRQSIDGMVSESRPLGLLEWFDSYTIDRVNQSMTVYPRLGAPIDITELSIRMADIGFEPDAIFVRDEVRSLKSGIPSQRGPHEED